MRRTAEKRYAMKIDEYSGITKGREKGGASSTSSKAVAALKRCRTLWCLPHVILCATSARWSTLQPTTSEGLPKDRDQEGRIACRYPLVFAVRTNLHHLDGSFVYTLFKDVSCRRIVHEHCLQIDAREHLYLYIYYIFWFDLQAWDVRLTFMSMSNISQFTQLKELISEKLLLLFNMFQKKFEYVQRAFSRLFNIFKTHLLLKIIANVSYR